MPELPEVETIVQGLKSNITNSIIINLESNYRKIIKDDFVFFKSKVINQEIINISRYGKYLFLHLSNEFIVVIHLRMTGQLFIVAKDKPIDKHTHLEILLKSKDKKIIYRDIRKFGRFELIDKNHYSQYLIDKKLGTDALNISFQDFYQALTKKTGILKSALLNQAVIAGIGNIYADEILFRNKLSPKQAINTLSKPKIKSLLSSIKLILKEAILKNGTSFSDYVNAIGQKGKFQFELKVYQRQGKPCFNCGSIIIREKIAGRGSYFCPTCAQKAR